MSGLDERRFKAELRERGKDGSWAPKTKCKSVPLYTLIERLPSPGWGAAAGRIGDLKRGDHTRVELDSDTALILERE
jgi:hypothetical protein